MKGVTRTARCSPSGGGHEAERELERLVVDGDVGHGVVELPIWYARRSPDRAEIRFPSERCAHSVSSLRRMKS